MGNKNFGKVWGLVCVILSLSVRLYAAAPSDRAIILEGGDSIQHVSNHKKALEKAGLRLHDAQGVDITPRITRLILNEKEIPFDRIKKNIDPKKIKTIAWKDMKEDGIWLYIYTE
jgi:hypothetical protein